MDQKTDIGDRIRLERERLGLTQPAFAALGDASKSSQLAWERETAYPNLKVLAAWARAGADVGFIASGRVTATGLSSEEETLVAYYREAPREVKRAALSALISASAADAVSGTQMRDVTMNNNAVGGVQIGFSAGAKVKVPKRS